MSTEYLELRDLVTIAEAFLGHPPEVRDFGLLESALARPRATVFGDEAYPSLDDKAAALMLSLVGNHALVDGNERLGWVAALVFYELNGFLVEAPAHEATGLVLGIAAGTTDDVRTVGRALAGWKHPL